MFDKYIGIPKSQSFYVLNSCKTISPICPLCFTSDPHIDSAPFWAASKVNSRSTQSQYIDLTSPLCQCFPGPHYHGLIFAFFTILLPKKIHILKRGWKFWAKWVQSCHLEVNFQHLSFFSLSWMIKLPPSSICAGKAVRGVV